MDNIFGNKPVSGDDFFGREDFVKHLKGILISKNSFLLLGLRRTGKSSVLEEIVRLIGKENPKTIVINLNCQTYESIHDLYKNIYLSLPHTWRSNMRDFMQKAQSIPKKLIDVITDHVEEVDIPYIGSVKLRNDALAYANPLKELLTRFFDEQKHHIVIILDELPFLFENIAEANKESTKLEIEAVLTTLRSWRNIGVSQAICGSLHLHAQLQNLGISQKLLGGVMTQTLPKFTTNEAKTMMQKLSAEHLPLKDADLDEIIHLLPDCIPQFLRYFIFSLNTHWNGEKEGIKTIYDKYVYPNVVKDFEYQFNERFASLSTENIVLAKKILSLIYKKPSLTEAELLRAVKDENAYSVLLILDNHEFIIINENNQIDFSFEIVRHWWHKKMI
jgi:AAA+ ATPase superfamily predicted ATPase